MADFGDPQRFRLEISRQALKYLVRMRPADSRRVREALDKLCADPDRRDLDVKPLQGRPAFRLRVGDWRVIYTRQDTLRILSIERIAPRGDVYKK